MHAANITVTINELSQAKNPDEFKFAVFKRLGAMIDAIDVHGNFLLVCTYFPPEKSRGGIILTDKSKSENRFQGKVGLVLKKGPSAFLNDAHNDFHGKDANPGDWVWFRYADSWEIGYAGLSCRIVSDAEIKGTTTDPLLFF